MSEISQFIRTAYKILSGSFFRHGVFQINFVTHADKRYTSNPMHLSQRHMNSPFVGCCTPDMRVTGLCASLPPPMESHLHPYVFDAPLRCVREQKNEQQ